jgi:hypothetical protein
MSSRPGARPFAVTLGPVLAPGTNRKGHAAGAAWTYLLPDLSSGVTVALGAPPPRSLPTLVRCSEELVIVVTGARRQFTLEARLRRLRATNAQVLRATGTRLWLTSGSADVVVVTDARWLRRLEREPALAGEVRRVMASHAVVYAQWPALKQPHSLPAGISARDLLWVHTIGSEVASVAPRDDERAIEHLIESRAAQRAANKEERSWPNRVRRHVRQADREHLGALTGPWPPHYLRAAAAQAGMPIDDHRWTLSAPGGYPSKKVLLQLFAPGRAAPEYLVKFAREPRFNDRVENSWVALRQLHERDLAAPAVVPEPVFAGHAGGLAFAAERAVAGSAFRARTTARPDCALARAALDWFVDLGAKTADPRIASCEEVGTALLGLLDRFRAAYEPRADVREFLGAQIATVAAHPGTFSVAFQHGDPGIWNLLVDPEGALVVLDWEAADIYGMPLWDVFYFMRSFGVWVARAGGTTDQLRGFEQQFFEPSALNDLLGDGVARICHDAGIDRALVEPLFYTCWMHRALKEASTRSRHSVGDGRYFRLLLRCIEQRGASGLQRLFNG